MSSRTMQGMIVHRGDGGLRVLLQFQRVQQAGDPHAFRFEPQDYILPTEGGGSPSAHFPWTQEVMADLSAVREPGRDPALLQRMGELLRRFVLQAGWERHEEQIAVALAEGRRVVLTVRSSAAELYALPWELLPLKSGQFIGEVDWLLLRFEWPDSPSRSERPSPRAEGGRILVAWSAAGGTVPAAEHVGAIADACAAGFHPFHADRDVRPHASLPAIVRDLQAAEAAGSPIAIIHLLCHGATAGSTRGLVLDGDGGPVVVDAIQLRQQLAPFSSMVRLVVVSACESGHGGDLGNHLGSVAQALHRCGFQAVIASRFPLSVAGSISLTQSFYHELLCGPASLETALLAARKHLAQRETRLPTERRPCDWASLQLYARLGDGDDTRPLVFRPYRGLLAFEPQHGRFFFGRDDELKEICDDLHALIATGRPRLLVVAGASGTGKSSLVLASAVPRLLQEKGIPWQLVRLRPGSEPQKALRSAFPTAAEPGIGTPQRFLIVVDQFEEIFTHGATAAMRQAFLQELWSLAQDPRTGTSVIVTLRVDFIGQCGELSLDETGRRFDRVAYDEAHRVFIAQLGEKQLRAAIEEPARKVGLGLEEGLVNRILQDVGSEPGALPALEYTLDLLWQGRQGAVLTQAAYDAAGGLGGALHRRADMLIDALDKAEQQIARRLLVRLVRVSEDLTQSTRRRVPLSKLRQAAPDDGARFDRAVSMMVDARLLVRDQERHDPEVMIEVAHEALIRKWPRLTEWVHADRNLLAELEKIEAWVGQWRDRKLGTLLTGNQIGYVAELEKDLGEDFPRDAHELLVASQAQQARQRRFRQVTLLLLLVAAVVATGFGFRARRAQQQTQQRLVQLYEEQGLQELRQGDALRALVYLSKAYSETEMPSVALRTALGQATQAADVQQVSLVGHTGWVHQAVFNPDGTRVVTAGADSLAKIWDAQSGQELFTLRGHRAAVRSAVFSPDGARLLTASADGTAKIWDAQSGRELQTLDEHQQELWSASFSADGLAVVTTSRDQTAKIWDARSGQVLQTLKGHKDVVRSAAFSTDGYHVVTGSRDQTARIWEVQTGKELRVLQGHVQAVHSVTFNSDGTQVLTTSFDKTAKLWNARTGELLRTLQGHSRAVYGGVFSPDWTRVLTSSWDGTAKIWDSATGQELTTLRGHQNGLFHAAFSADGSRVVTASMDHTAKIWDALGGREIATLTGHTDEVMSVSISRDGALLLSASDDGTARIWSVRSGKEQRVLRGHKRSVTRAVFRPDGMQVASSGSVGEVKIWDPKGGQESRSFSAHQGAIWGLAFSPDGTRLATAGNDESACIWDPHSGQELMRLRGHESAVFDVAFSPDGARVVTASSDNTARIWDVQSGKELFTLAGHQDDVLGAAFNPAGTQVVTAGKDRVVKVWDARDGRELLSLHGHQDGVQSARFSADGSRLVTAGRDNVAKIWDVADAREILSLHGHAQVVRGAEFSPDGATVVTAAADQTIKLWNVAMETRRPAQIAALVRCRALFQMTAQGRLQQTTPQTADCPVVKRALLPAHQLVRIGNLRASAWVAARAHNWAQAERDGQESLRLAQEGAWLDEEATTRLVLAQVARGRADLRGAQAQLERALALSQTSQFRAGERQALTRLGVLKHEDLHDPVAALADFDRARALQPDSPEILVNRAEAQLAAGQFDAYVRDLPDVMKALRGPDDRVALAAYAWAAALLTDSADTKQRAQDFLKAYPAWPVAQPMSWTFGGIRQALTQRQRPGAPLDRVLAVLALLEQPRSPDTTAQLAALLAPPSRAR